MSDKLNLLDSNIPLIERYNKYLEWDSQYSFIAIQIVAQKLEISEANVEVFFDLGKLDEDEFNTIDNCKIPIDHLFLVIKEDKDKRIELYKNYSTIINDTNEPVKAIRNYIDGDNEPLFRHKIENLSPEVCFSIASYLKSSGIVSGPINRKFRGFIVSVGRILQNQEKEVSDKQIDWIIKAINHSYVNDLNVFNNDIIKNDYQNDYLIFQEIIYEIIQIEE